MSFEFFFGLFGLIASNSKVHHKSKLDGDWRFFTPLNAGLFKDQKVEPAPGEPGSRASNDFKRSAGDSQRQQAIFSTSGTLSSSGRFKWTCLQNRCGQFQFLTFKRPTKFPKLAQPTKAS